MSGGAVGSSLPAPSLYPRPLGRNFSGSCLIGLARPDLRQQLFCLHFLLKAFAQQGGGLWHVELTGPRNEGAVPRHLIVFDRLARCNKAGIDRGAFAEILNRFLT